MKKIIFLILIIPLFLFVTPKEISAQVSPICGTDGKCVCTRDLIVTDGILRSTFCSVAQLYNLGVAGNYEGCGFGQQCFIGNTVGTDGLSCDWSTDNVGATRFCFSGFSSIDQIKSHKIEFTCKENCGGIPSGVVQTYDLGQTTQYASDEKGGYYSCIQPLGYDETVKTAIKGYFDRMSQACGFSGLLVGSAFLAGGSIFAIPVTVPAGIALNSSCIQGLESYKPVISTKLVSKDGNILRCERNLIVQFDFRYDQKTNLCNVGLAGDRTIQGINSAIGCIPITDINALIIFVVSKAAQIAGGIAFLMIVWAGFQILASRGDRQKVADARNLLTSALGGLLLIIFSVFIIRNLVPIILSNLDTDQSSSTKKELKRSTSSPKEEVIPVETPTIEKEVLKKCGTYQYDSIKDPTNSLVFCKNGDQEIIEPDFSCSATGRQFAYSCCSEQNLCEFMPK